MSKQSRLACYVPGALLLAGLVGGAPERILFRNVRVFDGERAIAANSVWIDNGKIAKVGRDLPAQDRTIVDGQGGTLMPGLIDAHVHSTMRAALQQSLLFGVTTVCDMTDDPRFSIPIQRNQARGGDRDLADIFTSGWPVTTPGGHGTQFGVPCPTLRSADEAQKFVDERIAEGSNYIKIIYDTGHELGFEYKNMTREMVAATVEAARRRGKLTVIHTLERKLANEAIEVGANGFAHLFIDEPPDPDFGKRAAARKMFAIATLTTLESSCSAASGEPIATDPALAPFLTPSAVAGLKGSMTKYFRPPKPFKLEYAFEAVRQFVRAKAPILAGTDSPVPGSWYGASLHGELALLVRAGMTPTQALAAATSVPAKVFSLKDRGRIAPGMRADLLLLRGDPTRDVLKTRDIVGIWKLGTRIDRQALKDTWEEAIKP